MNIQFLTPSFLFNHNKVQKNNSVQNDSFVKSANSKYPNLAPLAKDTVSFTSSPMQKILLMRNDRVAYGVLQDIVTEAQHDVDKFVRTLKAGLKGLVESPAHPDNLIVAGTAGIKGRAKSARSLGDKIPEDMITKGEIDNVGDLRGTRIVMRAGTQQDYDKLFKELGKMVTRGEFKPQSVENYRLTSKDSYVSQSTLNKFETVCQKMGIYPEIISKPKESGYTAVHLNALLPNGKPVEIQIMGRDMELNKDIQDQYYKWMFCHKDLDPKYRKIQKVFEEEIPKLDDFQLETLKRYMVDAFAHARKVPPKHSKRNMNMTKDFLDFPYSLPQRLSYRSIFEMMQECDKIAKAEKAAKAAKKAKNKA